ncbi:MAG: magnesium/cobalt transporter CorA [Verrucomicrobiales bacterium]|nr:magnesium/cobalt transporter CorA [Verrucomicrobiales bacterium]
MKISRKRFRKKPGGPPGEAVFIGEASEQAFRIELMTYQESSSSRRRIDKVEDLAGAVAKDQKAWIYASGIHQVEEVEILTDHLKLDKLSLEDILNTDHRPKIAFFDDHILIILKVLDPSLPGEVHHMSLVLMKDRVVTFSNCPIEFFAPVLERMENDTSRIRRFSSDYLAWAIMDLIVDHYLIISAEHESILDEFDDRLLEASAEIDSARLFSFKSQVNKLHRQIRPVREIVHHLKRSDSPILTAETRPFFDDLFDHIIHVIEDSEQLREQATEIRDFYLATVNNRMNEVMKMLTCFSAIFLPLTFLVGVYGMNFTHMPELDWKWSYPAIWVLFVTSALFLLRLFKKRNWL